MPLPYLPSELWLTVIQNLDLRDVFVVSQTDTEPNAICAQRAEDGNKLLRFIVTKYLLTLTLPIHLFLLHKVLPRGF
jgi:hypothetical protein